MRKQLVILGPTATGKTDLALILAKKYGGELVACDSRQVYRGLDIGTGKAPSGNFQVSISNSQWIIDGVPIYMYDVVDPRQRYSFSDYVAQSTKVIEGIINRGNLPIIVGGTGLYLKALLEGLPNLAIPVDPDLRSKLEKLTLDELQIKLQKLDPQKWEGLNNSDRNNSRRIIRSIELINMNPYIQQQSQNSNLKTQKYNTLKIGLTAPREILNDRIDQRLLSRIDQGLIEEGERLASQGVPFQRMRQLGLEYGVLADFLEGEISKDLFLKDLKVKIHQYAKRQMTWFKKEKNVTWFDVTTPNWLTLVESRVQSWYYSKDE